ncbi:methyltransferase domain-containing protein [Amycolatopsis acidicola]|uniref:Methyltransferase domain-containing protein n=1 Tax=Amycolatopsis acidicola TaxID=2596893 RepID=A0A5N0V0U7_9PSEU|nr:methyltransferase domain-containing protein [Amycolatopsis acidicola]KAA9157920.1 methyltransferase domain-containing protein [Amycolatopsis acidicola]
MHPKSGSFTSRDRDDQVLAQFGSPGAAARYAAEQEGAGSSARFAAARRRLVLRALSSPPGPEVLDLGCGPGQTASALLPRFRVTALDRSPAMAEECTRRCEGAVRAVVGTVEDLPLLDNHFDAVLLLGVLEYTDAARVFHEASRVLRSGGLLLASMLNPGCPHRVVQLQVKWPLLRLARAVERALGVPPERRHGRVEHGMRILPPRAVRDLATASGLVPAGVTYFDPMRPLPAREITGGWRASWATGYLFEGRKP